MKCSFKILFLILLSVSIICGLSPAYLLAQEVHLDVPFVPTPYEVIEDMLRFAELKKGDILYDLGCGDGRIVIEAAKRAGIKAVGIDIDPERIKESRENARLAGVSQLVEFRRQDIFQADFREATVVTMYLLPEVNIRLRPKLLATLKPGTRVISHDFDLDDWLPEKMTYAAIDLYVHTVYLWIVPANISGIWDWKMNSDQKKINCRMEIEQRFQYFKGKVYLGEKELILNENKLVGSDFNFEIQPGNSEYSNIRFSGKVEDNNIRGVILIKKEGKNLKQSWAAYRRPETSGEIDH